MKSTHTFLLVFLNLSFWCFGQYTNNSDLKAFNDFLGEEKASALDAAVASFDEFLITNYPNEENQPQRTKAFLRQLVDKIEVDSSWIFQTYSNKRIINAFETSGFRKEFSIYHYEEDDYTPYDVKSLLPPPEPDTNTGDLGEIEAIIDEEIDPLPPDSAEIARIAVLEAERKERYLSFLFCRT